MMKKLLPVSMIVLLSLLLFWCGRSAGYISPASNGNLTGASRIPVLYEGDTRMTPTRVDEVLDKLSLTHDNGVVSLLGIDGETIASFNLPVDNFLKEVYYRPDSTLLVFVFITEDEAEQVKEDTVRVDVSELGNYLAGDGLNLYEGIMSLKLDPATESYLSVSGAGLKLSGLQASLQTVNYGSGLAFGASYVSSAAVQRIRRYGNTVSFEFVLNIAASADIYGKTVTICSNVPTGIGLGGESVPLSVNFTPSDDAISGISSFTGKASLQGTNISITIGRNTSGAKLAQITLTGTHITEN